MNKQNRNNYVKLYKRNTVCTLNEKAEQASQTYHVIQATTLLDDENSSIIL